MFDSTRNDAWRLIDPADAECNAGELDEFGEFSKKTPESPQSIAVDGRIMYAYGDIN